MDITEHQRHELHKNLEQAIGSQSASTLMSYLPPVGWADVATKRDLESLEHRLEALEHRLLAKFFQELNSQTKTLVFAMSTMVLTVAALAFAAAHLV